MQEIWQAIVKFFNHVWTNLIDWENLWKWFVGFLPKFIGALLIFIIGWWLSGVIANILTKGMAKAKVDQGIRTFLNSCIKVIIKIIVLISALSTLGMNVTTLVAALGTAGVAVGLALKDSLSNFASGVLILFNRIFKVGDFIEIDGEKGTVRRIDSVLTRDMVVNYTAKDIRRQDMSVGVAYGSDILAVKKAILAALRESKMVSWDKEPTIGISSFDDSAITFDVKVWVFTKTFNESRYEINENILSELTKAGIEIPFNQLDVHMVG